MSKRWFNNLPERPDGYRSTVVALAITQTLSWAVLYYGFSSFVLPMHASLGWSKPTLMGAVTLSLLVWGLATYATGAAIDHGHGRAVMSAGTVLGVLGCGLWAAVSQPWMLYAAMAVVGLAMAMTLYEPAFAVLTKRYPLHYRQGITTLTLVAGFASTVSFPACALLIEWLGWRQAMAVLAVVLAVGVLPVHLWVLRGPAMVAAPQGHDVADDATLREALRHKAFWLLALAFTLNSFAGAALWAHAMPIFASKGLGVALANAVVVWVGPAQVLGRFIYTWLYSGVPLRRLGYAVLAVMPLAFLLLAQASEYFWLMVFALLFGLANGLITIVRGGLVPEVFGRTHIGRISGAMSALTLLARAAAPLVTAWLLLGFGSYREVLWVLCGLAFTGLLAYVAAVRPGPVQPLPPSPPAR